MDQLTDESKFILTHFSWQTRLVTNQESTRKERKIKRNGAKRTGYVDS